MGFDEQWVTPKKLFIFIHLCDELHLKTIFGDGRCYFIRCIIMKNRIFAA